MALSKRHLQIFTGGPRKQRIRTYGRNEEHEDRNRHQPRHLPTSDYRKHDLRPLVIALHFIRDLIRTQQEATLNRKDARICAENSSAHYTDNSEREVVPKIEELTNGYPVRIPE